MSQGSSTIKYEAVIGLEIHIQLKTNSKMFCPSANSVLDAPANTHICEVCTAQPGTLPAPNIEAIKKAATVGLALGCKVAEFAKFDRKNYFYPDLPKGYQISQYDEPFSSNGQFNYIVDGYQKTIRIRRAHLEEDTGKLIHEGSESLVDFNRAGVPLLEIVTEPDFTTPQEVREFLMALRNIVRYLDVSEGDMEKGHLRGEPNISVRAVGDKQLPNYKVELKNINSFKNVYDSLVYEIKRQTEALKNGEKLLHETRGWDGEKTIVQRIKEDAHDYRYFPEPDLPIVHMSPEFVEKLRLSLPELPNEKEKRFIAEFALSEQDAEVLVSDRYLASYFENVMSELLDWYNTEQKSTRNIGQLAKSAVNWIVGEYQALLKTAQISALESKVTAENMAELVKMIELEQVSKTAGKQVLGMMFEKGGDPSNIVQDQALGQISNLGDLGKIVEEVVSANSQAVADFKAGKERALGALVGQVMAKSKGQANPQVVNEILKQKLK